MAEQVQAEVTTLINHLSCIDTDNGLRIALATSTIFFTVDVIKQLNSQGVNSLSYATLLNLVKPNLERVLSIQGFTLESELIEPDQEIQAEKNDQGGLLILERAILIRTKESN